MADEEVKPQRIPVFKSSGNLISDLLTIKKAEIIAFGAWRAAVRISLTENGNQLTLTDGTLAYSLNEKLDKNDIEPSTKLNNANFAQKMLMLAGMDKDALDELRNDLDDNGLRLYWKGDPNYNTEQLELVVLDLESFFVDNDISYFKLKYTSQRFNEEEFPTATERVPKKLLVELDGSTDYEGLYVSCSGFNSSIQDDVIDREPDFDTDLPGKLDLWYENYLSAVTLEIYDVDDTLLVDDPESPEDESFFEMNKIIKLLLLISFTNVFENRTIESYVEREEADGPANDNGVQSIGVYHDVVERYDATFIADFAENNIGSYHEDGDTPYTEQVFITPADTRRLAILKNENKTRYQDFLWSWIDSNIPQNLDDNAYSTIFVKTTDANGLSQLYLTDWGIRSAPPNLLAAEYGNHFGLKVISKKVSTWKKIIAVIIMAIIIYFSAGTLASALAGLAMTIPSIIALVQAVVSFVNAIKAMGALLGGGASQSTNENDAPVDEEPSEYEGDLERKTCISEYETFCQYETFPQYEIGKEFETDKGKRLTAKEK